MSLLVVTARLNANQKVRSNVINGPSPSSNRHSSAGMQVISSHEQVDLAWFLFGQEQQEGPLGCSANYVGL